MTDQQPEVGGDDPRIWLTSELAENPVTARARCKRLGSLLTAAELDVRRERDASVAAEIEFKKARRRAQLGGKAPHVERNGATAAERDAWVENECSDEHDAMLIAAARYDAAKDHWRRVESQGILGQAILKSVDRAFTNVHTGDEGR